MLSTGKDSVVQLDLCSKYFERVCAVHLYHVKGLEYRDRYIKNLLSRYKNVSFSYIPHYSLSYINTVYGSVNEMIGQFTLTQKDSERVIRRLTGGVWIAYGYRKDESLQRRGMLSAVKGKDDKTKRFYPLYNFTQRYVDKYIVKMRLPLPPEYECGFRDIGMYSSPDTLDWLKNNYPKDYVRTLEQFPLLEGARIAKGEKIGYTS